MKQVNTDYVVRQEDGLPFTFKKFPGSIVDMAEASEMIRYLKDMCDGIDISITLVCDRGYISEDNVTLMDECGMSFLLMLKSNMNDHAFIMDNYCKKVKNRYECYMEEFDEFGMTIKRRLFGKGPARYFHLIWNPTLEGKHRTKLLNSIQKKRSEIKKHIKRKTRFSEDEIFDLPNWFFYEYEEAGKITVKPRGRGKKKTVTAYIITSYDDNKGEIFRQLEQCGFYLLVTSDEMVTIPVSMWTGYQTG